MIYQNYEQNTTQFTNKTQTFIVDLVEAGGPAFRCYLSNKIRQKPYEDIFEYNFKINNVFSELLTQIMLIMDCRTDEFLLHLLTLPNFDLLIHIEELANGVNDIEFINQFKSFALGIKIGIGIDSILNRSNENVDYILLSSTSTYMVVMKTYKG